MSLNPAETNSLHAVTELLRLGNVRVTRRTVKEWLWQHPDFPSLASLSDLLTFVNVSHLATRLPAGQLAEIPLPALVEIRADQTTIFAPLRRVSADMVEWFHTGKGWQTETLTSFLTRWTGVALLVDPDDTSGEVNYGKSRRTEWMESSLFPFMGLGIVFCLYLFLASVWPVTSKLWVGLWLIKLAGFIVSSLLVAYSLNANNPLLQKLCTLGKQTSCRDILQSDAAKLLSWLSWSDVGLLYFAGVFVALSLAMFTGNASAVTGLVALNIIALPYTVWSVWYQVVVARQFCVLCLTVQVLLWAEFATGRLIDPSFSGLIIGAGLLTAAFTGVVIVWGFVRLLLNQSTKVAPLERALRRTKFSASFLQTTLAGQSRMPDYLQGMNVLTLGNPTAENVLTVVTNPLCVACQDTHRQTAMLLTTQADLRCAVVFAASLKTADKDNVIAQRLLGLPADHSEKALHEWFRQPGQSVAPWSRRIKAGEPTDETARQLILHTNWCVRARVHSTPVLYLNGILLPDVYSIADVPQLCRLWPREIGAIRTMDLAESQ